MEPLKLIIADNQELTRLGIKLTLLEHYTNLISIDEVSSKKELIEKLTVEKYNALIIDYQLFCVNINCEFNEIKILSPNTKILVVTTNHTSDDIFKVIDSGVTNYILKTSDTNELIEAFNATLSNRKYFSSEILDLLLEYKTSSRHINEKGSLTASEIEIIKQIARGLTTKEIAAQKGLSYHTIITHRKNIFRKLNISNVSELIIYAMKKGWIDSVEYYI